MKKQYFFALLLLLMCLQNTHAQWIRIITAEQSNPLGKVQTVTPDVVYAANNYGRQLYRSGDGGNTWAYTTGQIANTYPNAFYFTSADTGFVVGDKGYIYKTVNGGASYTTIPRPYQHYKDITFTSKTTGFIVGNGRMNVQPADSAFILKTTDGGSTWSYFNLGHTENMTAITFFDENNGCAVGNMGRIHVTNDGGATWSPRIISITNTLYDVSMPAANVIYAAGYNVFVQSVNGGSNWTNVNTGQTGFPTYSGMYFMDSANGYVAYPSGLLTKTNSVWSRFTKINTSLLHVHFLNATHGFATGNDGYIYKYVGNTPILAIGDPQSGKSLFRKQNYNITWSSNAIDTVMVEYRTSPSSPWQTLSAKEPASKGYFTWNVPDIEATEVSVRVTDIANSTNTSKTNDNITITLEKNITITSPYKYSASLIAGKKLRIAWTALNIDTVKIEYRMNSNLSWVTIANKVSAGSGSYLFALPLNDTRNLQFKVSSVTDARYADSTLDGKLRQAAINVNDPIWSLQNPKPFLGSVKDAQFIDADIIYALADPNLFVKSGDKGATWTIVKTLPVDGETFKGLHFLNANLGYVLMGDDYTTNLYKTTDAGLNWILTYEGLP
ncbi:MAG: YCF48-related protein, partial [Bacteroidota bacterium]